MSTGFNPRVVDESKSKPKYDLKCEAPGCDFVVKVRPTKLGGTETAEVNLRHNHEPLDFDEPDELDAEGKQVHDDVTECLQQARKAFKAKAKDEIVHLRDSADYRSTSTSDREAAGYLSYTSEQELVVWDLCDLLDENAARAFERAMRDTRQLADDYPVSSSLDIERAIPQRLKYSRTRADQVDVGRRCAPFSRPARGPLSRLGPRASAAGLDQTCEEAA